MCFSHISFPVSTQTLVSISVLEPASLITVALKFLRLKGQGSFHVFQKRLGDAHTFILSRELKLIHFASFCIPQETVAH